MNRKSFLQSAARLFFLGGFAGGAIYLGKSGRLVAPGNCDKTNQCKACGSLSACNLPQALNERSHGKR